MHDYGQGIRELQRQIVQLNAEIGVQLRKLGEHLSYQDAAVLHTDQLKQLHRRIQELRHRLPESRQQVKLILQTVEGNRALEKELQQQNRQLSEIAHENEAMYEEIGSTVYRVRNEEQIPKEIFGKLFAVLERKQRELAQLEQELEPGGRQRSARLFKRIGKQGRTAYLIGRLSIRRRAVTKVCWQIGKKFCEYSSDVHAYDTQLREVLKPFAGNQRKAGKLRQEVKRLNREREAKWRQLKSLGAYRSHHRRVREIESEIEAIETKLQIEFQTLGRGFMDVAGDETGSVEIAALQTHIREHEGARTKKTKQIERLNAAIQIDIVQEKLGHTAERIARLEEEIESRRREVDDLRVQIQDGEKQIQRLKRVRGSSQSLHTITNTTERTDND